MKIKANKSFIGKNGLTMTSGEIKDATEEQAAWAIKLKLADAVKESPADEKSPSKS